MLSMVVDCGRVVLSVWLLAHQLRIDAFRQDSVGKKYTEKRLKSTVQFEIYKTWLDGNHTFKGQLIKFSHFQVPFFFSLVCAWSACEQLPNFPGPTSPSVALGYGMVIGYMQGRE